MSNRTEYSELTKTELLHDFYALQARLDEAVALLRRIYYDTADDVTRKVFAAPDSVASYAADFCVLDAARAFLSTLENGGA